jgi:CSLREA domain-containing protein
MFPRRKPTLFLLATLLVFCFLAIQPSPATAVAEAFFLVDSMEDLPDFAPGNSVCSANQIIDGPCTLRAAITEANLNIHSYNITIILPPGIYTLTIPSDEGGYSPNNGDLDIQSNSTTNRITIMSTGAPGDVVITAGPNFQDRILEIGEANVSISDIVFSGANFVIAPNQYAGGAIYNKGTLKLNEVKFTDNSVSCKPGEDCEGYGVGGAILNKGTLTIVDSSFIRSSADRGSAIFNAGGDNLIDISHSMFTQNSSSTIENYSSISIKNSTFSGGDSGFVNEGQLFLRSNTFTNFSETIRNRTDKYVYSVNNIFTTQASKIFHGTGGDWLSGGYNIFSDDSWPATYAAGDLSSTNPKLSSLGYYGGPTLTHALQQGSPAIDHRPGKCFGALHPIDEDQRHFPRDDGYCDTGAFEHSGNFFKMLYLPLIQR